MRNQLTLILSCEHAVNRVPDHYQTLFTPYKNLLNSHRGIDFGALALANYLQTHFQCKLVSAQTTRLLIDCNRSLAHQRAFSEITRVLATPEKQAIIQQYYLPFRQQVNAIIQKKVNANQQVLHLSMHSFTPILHGVRRQADIGLLYDPSRSREKNFAKQWQRQLQGFDKYLKIRMNYPYRGISDGFTTALRKQYDNNAYMGLEVEFNQKCLSHPTNIKQSAQALIITLENLLTGWC